MSKCFSAEFARALDFEPWCRELVQRCLKHVLVLENIKFCSLFANPFHDFNHHSNQHQSPLPLLIGDMRSSAEQSLAVCLVLVMMSASLSLTVLNASTLQTCLLN